MSDEKKWAVNYEADDEEVMDEVETEIELLDTDYVEDEDDTDEVKVPTAEELEQRKRADDLKARLESGENSTADAMKEVVEQLRELKRQPQSGEQRQAVEEWETVRKRIADGFYDDPVAAVETLYQHMQDKFERERLQPAFQQIGQVVRDTALDSSKRSAKESDSGKFVMERYLGEVEELVNSGQVQVGPGAYNRAVQQVMANHIDEYVDWKMETKAAEQAARDAENPPVDTRQPARGSNPGSSGRPPSPNSKVQVSRAARDAIYRMADTRMLDREMFFDSYVRNHPEKIRELNRRKK